MNMSAFDFEPYEAQPEKMAEIDRAHNFWNAMLTDLLNNLIKYQFKATEEAVGVIMDNVTGIIYNDSNVEVAIDFMNERHGCRFNFSPEDADKIISKNWLTAMNEVKK
jgi:hypothetical protein